MKIAKFLSIVPIFAGLILSQHSNALSYTSKKVDSASDSSKSVYIYTLKNDLGMTVEITNYRGIIKSIKIPDKNNHQTDVVLGYDNIDAYYKDKATFFGSIVGRYANRIAKGELTIDGIKYQLVQNNNTNSLHSGLEGFNNAIWDSEIKEVGKDKIELILSYTSPSFSVDKVKSQGFPGNLKTEVIYILDNKENKLSIEYKAVSDADTFINLTNHSYFNLNGEGNSNILNHKVYINADFVTPTDEQQIPTGKIQSVNKSPFDFRQFKLISNEIDDLSNEQIKFANGYDHNFVLNKQEKNPLSLAAKINSPLTGIEMTVFTTQPGMQFYTGNFLNNSIEGKAKHIYAKRTGFAFETQHYPDSPHHANFPSTLLKKGDSYKQSTELVFGLVTK